MADNVLLEADDAFGASVGNQSVGIYSGDSVRGFNPGSAGNLRIDGLYFDQQGDTSNRVFNGLTVRVGPNVAGYPFPAPTGIVDNSLREPRDEVRFAGQLQAGPFETLVAEVSVESSLPVAFVKVPMAIKAGTLADSRGATLKLMSFGVVPEWKPRPALTVRLFHDYLRVYELHDPPRVYLRAAAMAPPPHLTQDYFGQDWTLSDIRFTTTGAIVKAELGHSWQLAAGLFHSSNVGSPQYTDQFVDTDTEGTARHEFIGYPYQSQTSTSGELRLSWQRLRRQRSDRLIAMIRSRDVLAVYGGDDVRAAGTVDVRAVPHAPQPDFTYGERTRDRSTLSALGLAWETRWHGRGGFAAGLQKMRYAKRVDAPQTEALRRSDEPLRIYANGSVNLGRNWQFYGGYTQGLEDSGYAPPSASNRGAALPAARTAQRDAGLRWTAHARKLSFVAGVYDVRKPYYNAAADGSYGLLGEQRHRGVELSLSGDPSPALHLLAGLTYSRPAVYTAGGTTGIGPLAVGVRDHKAQLSFDLHPAAWRQVSFDWSISHLGHRAGNIANAFSLPAVTMLALGSRVRLPMHKGSGVLYFSIDNLGNSYDWILDEGAGYVPAPGRAISLSLTVER